MGYRAAGIAWRVHRRSGKQGRPQSVFDAETGTPLEIELDADIEELRPYGAGGYRLDAIDGDSKVMAGVTAYVEVPPDEVKAVVAAAPSETAATLREVTALRPCTPTRTARAPSSRVCRLRRNERFQP
jgi:hypothetical protein